MPANDMANFKCGYPERIWLLKWLLMWYPVIMLDGLPKLKIRSKVWLVDDAGDMVLGIGRVKMLEAIQRLGSMNAAAKELKVSTRAIWGRIKNTEERLGRPLLVRNVGGVAGGGSSLTDFAIALLDLFYLLNQNVERYSDELFKEASEKR